VSENKNHLNGVEVGLGRHEDGDGGHFGGLGHAVSVDELLVLVVRDLVVDGHLETEDKKLTLVKEHLKRTQFRVETCCTNKV
jgi:hypothetical protein